MKFFIAALIMVLFIGCGSSTKVINKSKPDDNHTTIPKKDDTKNINLPKLEDQNINFSHQNLAFFMLNDDFSGDFVITKMPDHGTIDGDIPNLNYTANEDFYADDTLKYKIATDEGDTNEATIRFHFVKRQSLEDETWIMKSSGDNPKVDLYDSNPSGAYYGFENENGKKVLVLHSNGIENSFHILGYEATQRYLWSDLPTHQDRSIVSWDSKFNDDFIIFIVLKFIMPNGTSKWLDLVYTPASNGYTNYTDDFMHIFLGSDAKDGQWHHYQRNILNDLHKFYPGSKIDYINGFAIRGSGKITDIKLSK